MATTRILVVDDDPLVLRTTCRVLGRGTMYKVISASGPLQALEIVRSEPPIDLVVSDVEMPDMHGPELLQEIAKISPETTCILMSGLETEDAHLPADVPFLHKPVSESELFSAVERVLAESLNTSDEFEHLLLKISEVRERARRLREESEKARQDAKEDIQKFRKLIGPNAPPPNKRSPK